MTVGLVIFFVLVMLPVVGRLVLLRARHSGEHGAAASHDRLQDQVVEDVRRRLESIATAVSGRVKDGPSLRTSRGVMTLAASRAPAELAIDIAKFSGPCGVPGSLTVIRAEDRQKLVATKGLHPVTIEDAEGARRYVALASDAVAGRRWIRREVALRLRALEEAVRARCRIQVVHGSASVLAFRGLAKAEELKSFHEGAVAVIDALDAASRPPA
jgi:hypothetical protein